MDLHNVCQVDEDLLEALKVFDSTSVKLMNTHKKIYNDKFAANKDAPDGYVS